VQPEFAFLCDYAEKEGKIHAVGIGWDTLYAPELPHRHPMIAFVGRVSGTAAEKGPKDISIRLLDADGEDVGPTIDQQLPFEVQPGKLKGNLEVVVQFGGIEFKKYGTYAIHLVIQGNEMASVSFEVSPPPTTT
jgi:hypothetical protein